MNTATVPDPRHTVEALPGELRITIPAKRKWATVVFSSVWLGFWLLGEVSVGKTLFGNLQRQQSFDPFSILWLCGWSIGGLFVLSGLLWQFVGREIVQVTDGELRIQQMLLGFRRNRAYTLNEVKALRIATPFNNTNTLFRRKQSMYGEPSLAFDYGASTVRFGRDLDEAEASQIVSTLQKRI